MLQCLQVASAINVFILLTSSADLVDAKEILLGVKDTKLHGLGFTRLTMLRRMLLACLLAVLGAQLY
jgi:hypothetical protein